MFLVISILQIFVFDSFGVPFWTTTVIFMLLINLYTFKGGIKTIVWTDMLQTTFMLAAVIISVILIKDQLEMSLGGIIREIANSDHSRMIFTDWQDKRFF